MLSKNYRAAAIPHYIHYQYTIEHNDQTYLGHYWKLYQYDGNMLGLNKPKLAQCKMRPEKFDLF